MAYSTRSKINTEDLYTQDDINFAQCLLKYYKRENKQYNDIIHMINQKTLIYKDPNSNNEIVNCFDTLIQLFQYIHNCLMQKIISNKQNKYYRILLNLNIEKQSLEFYDNNLFEMG